MEEIRGRIVENFKEVLDFPHSGNTMDIKRYNEYPTRYSPLSFLLLPTSAWDGKRDAVVISHRWCFAIRQVYVSNDTIIRRSGNGMMAHDDNDPNDSASCTIMIVRSRQIEGINFASRPRIFYRSGFEARENSFVLGLEANIEWERLGLSWRNESQRVVRTFPRDKGKRFRVQNRHFRRHECIFVLANGQRNAKSRLHRWCIQRPTWCTVNEALGTPWLECRVAVCNGHGMRERKSCSLAEIHVRSAEIRLKATPASFPMQDEGHGIATRAFNHVMCLHGPLGNDIEASWLYPMVVSWFIYELQVFRGIDRTAISTCTNQNNHPRLGCNDIPFLTNNVYY